MSAVSLVFHSNSEIDLKNAFETVTPDKCVKCVKNNIWDQSQVTAVWSAGDTGDKYCPKL